MSRMDYGIIRNIRIIDRCLYMITAVICDNNHKLVIKHIIKVCCYHSMVTSTVLWWDQGLLCRKFLVGNYLSK